MARKPGRSWRRNQEQNPIPDRTSAWNGPRNSATDARAAHPLAQNAYFTIPTPVSLRYETGVGIVP